MRHLLKRRLGGYSCYMSLTFDPFHSHHHFFFSYSPTPSQSIGIRTMMIINSSYPSSWDNKSRGVRSAIARNPVPRLCASFTDTRFHPITSSSCSRRSQVLRDEGAHGHDPAASKPKSAKGTAIDGTIDAIVNADASSRGRLERLELSATLKVEVIPKISGKKKIIPVPTMVEIMNLWTPSPTPATYHRKTPMASYDINTKLPFRVLQTDQIRLEPLVVSAHCVVTFTC